MDYSTASERMANTTYPSVSYDELNEQYSSLKCQHDTLIKQYEVCQQELHDTKRHHQFSLELKDHLTSEVEALQKNESKLKADFSLKTQALQEEVEVLRQEKWKDSENFTNTISTLENQILKLQQNEVIHPIDRSIHQLDNTKITDEIRRYEDEADVLKNTIVELKRELVESCNINTIHKADIESLQEQIECLNSNLNCKKEEIQSMADMLHSAQDDLCTANAELQMAKNQTNSHAVKGNSLFAEVDDKRQEMLKSLSQMKEKVYQLNRELVSKQSEIDSLLCEKKALWEEYAGQANHHDAVLNRGYERRITDLEKQTDQLHREIARWYDNNLDPASSDAAQWLSGVMEYYREENLSLSSDLAASSIDNLSKEKKLREAQRQLVTWRTKAMEANAAVSQLETKLQLAEKTVQMSMTSCNDTLKTMINESKVQDYFNETTLRNMESNREIDMSILKNSTMSKNLNKSIQIKSELPTAGILVTGVQEGKVAKKTSFQ